MGGSCKQHWLFVALVVALVNKREFTVFFENMMKIHREHLHKPHSMKRTAIPNRRSAGSRAEQLAAEHVEERGLHIIERNYRYGRTGEIDLIAETTNTSTEVSNDKPSTLVFIEVKARSSARYGTPEEAITPAKQRTIRRVAEGYLAERCITDRPCRFDVVAIEFHGETPHIRHLENAF